MQSAVTVPAAPHPLVAPKKQKDHFQNVVPDYALLFFDHLFSEYLTLKARIKDASTTTLLDSLQDKRLSGKLTWSDIYTFDLALIDERPLENLIRKAYDARLQYRSIAGQKEFDEYLASKPPDLTTILIEPNKDEVPPAKPDAVAGPAAQPDEISQPAKLIQRLLRADIRYLLSKFYLYYAMLPVREGLREQLTTRAVRMTKWILGMILILMVLSFGGSAILNRFVHGSEVADALSDLLGAFGPIVGSVVFGGIVGGCVSMLQRIQTAPTEGDALFNLAGLTTGWRGLSLSPLYGGIFASLVFVLFSAGLLQGSAFPKIVTSMSPADTRQTQAATQPDSNGSTNSGAQPTPGSSAVVGNAKPAPPEAEVLKIKDFLKNTRPEDGTAFALLLLWSFIAGFAERLVPDTLNRLVAKNEAIQGTNQ
jgi:hypothetical protein